MPADSWIKNMFQTIMLQRTIKALDHLTSFFFSTDSLFEVDKIAWQKLFDRAYIIESSFVNYFLPFYDFNINNGERENVVIDLNNQPTSN